MAAIQAKESTPIRKKEGLILQPLNIICRKQRLRNP